MSSSPNYKLIDFDYEPMPIFDILYKDSKMVFGSTTRVFFASESQILEIQNLLNIKNINHILCFYMPPRGHSSIHSDHIKPQEEIPFSSKAINLPLINSENVCMNWYNPLSDNIEKERNYNVEPPAPTVTLNQVKLVESAYYTQPITVEILKWHSVHNNSDHPAYFCSLRFKK